MLRLLFALLFLIFTLPCTYAQDARDLSRAQGLHRRQALSQLELQQEFFSQSLRLISRVRHEGALSHAITDMMVEHALTRMETQLSQAVENLRRVTGRLQFINSNCFNLNPATPTRASLFLECPQPSRAATNTRSPNATDYQDAAARDFATQRYLAERMAHEADTMAASYFRFLTQAAEGTGQVLMGATGSSLGVVGGVCIPALLATGGALSSLATLASEVSGGGVTSVLAHLIGFTAAVHTGQQRTADSGERGLSVRGPNTAGEDADEESSGANPNESNLQNTPAPRLQTSPPSQSSPLHQTAGNEAPSVDEARYQRNLARYRAALRRLRRLQAQALTEVQREATARETAAREEVKHIRSLEVLQALALSQLTPWQERGTTPGALRPWSEFLQEMQEALAHPEAHDVPLNAFRTQEMIIARIVAQTRERVRSLRFDTGNIEASVLALSQALQDSAVEVFTLENQTPRLNINGINCYEASAPRTMDPRCFSHLLVHAMNELSITMPSGTQIALDSSPPHQNYAPIFYSGSGLTQVRLNLLNGERQVAGAIPLPALYSSALLDAILIPNTSPPINDSSLIVARAFSPPPPEVPATLAAQNPNPAIPVANNSDLGPAQVRPIEQIDAQIRLVLMEWYRTGTVPADWATLMVEAEVARQNPRISQREYDAVLRNWQRILQEAREALARLPTDATAITRIETVRDILISRTVGNWVRDSASMLDALRKRGTNCQGNSQLLMSALQTLGVAAPPGERFATELFLNHVQIVTWNPQTDAVWDIMGSNQTTPHPTGWVYQTPLVGQSYLELARNLGSNVENPLTAEQLLLSRPPADSNGMYGGASGNLGSLLRLAMETGFRRPRNSLGWPLTLGMLFQGGLGKPPEVPERSIIRSPGHRTDAVRTDGARTPALTSTGAGTGGAQRNSPPPAIARTNLESRPNGADGPAAGNAPSMGGSGGSRDTNTTTGTGSSATAAQSAATNVNLVGTVADFRLFTAAEFERQYAGSNPSPLQTQIREMDYSCRIQLRNQCADYAAEHLAALRRFETFAPQVREGNTVAYFDEIFLRATRTFYFGFQERLQGCMENRIHPRYANREPSTGSLPELFLDASSSLAALGNLRNDNLFRLCSGADPAQRFFSYANVTIEERGSGRDIFPFRNGLSEMFLGFRTVRRLSPASILHFEELGAQISNKACNLLNDSENPNSMLDLNNNSGQRLVLQGTSYFLRNGQNSTFNSPAECPILQLRSLTFRRAAAFLESASRTWVTQTLTHHLPVEIFEHESMRGLQAQLSRELHAALISQGSEFNSTTSNALWSITENFYQTLVDRAFEGRLPTDPPRNAIQENAQRFLMEEAFSQRTSLCTASQSVFSFLYPVALLHHTETDRCYLSSGRVTPCAYSRVDFTLPPVLQDFDQTCAQSAVLERFKIQFRLNQIGQVRSPEQLIARLADESTREAPTRASERLTLLFAPENLRNPNLTLIIPPVDAGTGTHDEPAYWAHPLLRLFNGGRVGILERPTRPRAQAPANSPRPAGPPRVRLDDPNSQINFEMPSLETNEVSSTASPSTELPATTPHTATPVPRRTRAGAGPRANDLLLPRARYFEVLSRTAIGSGHPEIFWRAMTPTHVRQLLSLLRTTQNFIPDPLISDVFMLGINQIALQNPGSIGMAGIPRGISPELRDLIFRFFPSVGSGVRPASIRLPTSFLRQVTRPGETGNYFSFSAPVEQALDAIHCSVRRDFNQPYAGGSTSLTFAGSRQQAIQSDCSSSEFLTGIADALERGRRTRDGNTIVPVVNAPNSPVPQTPVPAATTPNAVPPVPGTLDPRRDSGP